MRIEKVGMLEREIGEEINPHVYTKEHWNKWSFAPFHKNVEKDKIVLID